MKVIILLHGAYQTSKIWDRMKPQLEKQSNVAHVVTYDIVGHESNQQQHKLKEAIDPTQFDQLSKQYSNITLDKYVNQLRQVILDNESRGEIHLVSHSISAIIVQQLISIDEQMRKLIKSVVFIAGMLTADGRSVCDYINMNRNTTDLYSNLISPSEDCTFFALKPDKIKQLFYTKYNDDTAQDLIGNMVLEPALPYRAKVSNKLYLFPGTQIYIETLNDQCMSLNLQRTIVAEQQDGQENDHLMVTSLNCDHCPMLSCCDILVERIMEGVCHKEQDINGGMSTATTI
jgi:hypothetical protein